VRVCFLRGRIWRLHGARESRIACTSFTTRDRQEFRHGGGSWGDLGHDRKTSVPRFMKNLKQVQNFGL
jgi:hypothetical protein